MLFVPRGKPPRRARPATALLGAALLTAFVAACGGTPASTARPTLPALLAIARYGKWCPPALDNSGVHPVKLP